jgi:hypothetical protein
MLSCPYFPEGGEGQTQAWMPTYVSILHIPQMIWVWRATVEWYWQGKTEELGEKPVPVPLCPPQIPHGLTQAWTRASAVRGRWLTTWAMARPWVVVTCTSQNCVSHFAEVRTFFWYRGYGRNWYNGVRNFDQHTFTFLKNEIKSKLSQKYFYEYRGATTIERIYV